MLTHALLPLLKSGTMAASTAHIINIGSAAGTSVHTATSFSYFASKAGMNHLTRVLAKNLVGDHICVNAIAPGYCHTELIDAFAPCQVNRARLIANVPLGRFSGEEDIASTIIFLAASGFITGQILAQERRFLLDG